MRLALAWLAAVVPLAAQEAPVFRSETSLALVRFHVAQKGHYVEGLRPEDVILLEDGQPRKFTLFESALAGWRTVPVELSVAFDTSGSVTHEGLLDPLVFKEGLLDGLGNVRVAVYGFGEKLRRYCAPTRDYDALRAALAALRDRRSPLGVDIPIELPPKRRSDPRGATWVYESVIGAARDAAARPALATRMLLVFSDGLSTTTSLPDDAATACNDLGIAVYPVLLGHWRLGVEIRQEAERAASKKDGTAPSSYKADQLETQERAVEAFVSLGKLTGGHAFAPPALDLTVLRRVLAGMVAEARYEYVVGFAPDGEAAGRPHKLEVRLRDKSLGQVLGGKRTLGAR